MNATAAFTQLQKDLSQSSFDGIQELLLIQKSKQLMVKKRGLNIVLENHVGRIAEREQKLKADFVEKYGNELQTIKTQIMSNLFKELAEAMEDRQEMILNIKKIGDDLVIMATPDLKKKGTVIQLTGSPEEMDINFVHEIKKPVKAKTEFRAEVVSTEKEEKPKASPSSSGKKKKVTNQRKSQAKAAPKKQAPIKKAAPKKVVKKVAPKKPEVKKATPVVQTTTKKQEEVKVAPPVVVDEKKIAEEAAAAKAKADKEAFEGFMEQGKKHYEAHEWQKSEAAYKLACALFPADTKANLGLINASKWVKSMEKAGLL